jgi:DNA-binding beta-propeller fold protein YncE
VAVLAPLSAAPAAPALQQLPGKHGCVAGPFTKTCTRTPYAHGPIQPVADPSNRLVYGVTTYRGAATVAAYIQYPDGHLLSLRPPGGCVRRPAGPKKARAYCSAARAMRKPLDLAMAPDGANLYVLTHGSELVNDGGVVTLRRRPDGTIRQPSGTLGCITQQAHAGCAKGRSMDQGRRLALSLDGASLYVTSQTGGVAILQRTDGTGALSQPAGEAGCVISQYKPVRSSCARVPVPDAVPVDLVVAPDGAFVYVLMAQGPSGAIVVYARDPGSGMLTFASCVAEDPGPAPCVPARGLAGAEAIAISPDGRSVYAAAHWYRDGGSVTTYSRDATLGGLTQLDGAAGCITAAPSEGCGQSPPFVRPSSIAVSHDGASVHVVYRNDTTGTGDGSILAEFSRDSTEGALTSGGCLARAREGCGRSRGVHGFTRVTISVDGRYMYLGGRSGLGIFTT